MILEVGIFGIIEIKNTNTSTRREMLSVYKGMPITGIVSIKKGDGDQYIMDLGYNETIILTDRQSAIILLNIVDGILSVGVEAEKAIENMIEAAQTMFFQEAA